MLDMSCLTSKRLITVAVLFVFVSCFLRHHIRLRPGVVFPHGSRGVDEIARLL